ncbi:MAG TPA: hypothetical protein VHT96_06935 [Clostridia bacterium]|nr:hypothetical protein [Clostridia bacterium]
MKINKAGIPSLVFAIAFTIIGFLRFDDNNLVDTGFYILAVIGFITIFFTINKNVK